MKAGVIAVLILALAGGAAWFFQTRAAENTPQEQRPSELARPGTAAGIIEVVDLDGGSVVTNLSYGIAVNKGSKLRRRWFVLNDSGCPVKLKDVGINTIYTAGGSYSAGGYSYEAAGTLQASQPIQAVEVRHLLFDLWGERMSTLSNDVVKELEAGVALELKGEGTWYASENDVAELLSVVSYIAHVRTAEGRIWRYDPRRVLDQVQKVRLHLDAGGLSPSPPRK